MGEKTIADFRVDWNGHRNDCNFDLGFFRHHRDDNTGLYYHLYRFFYDELGAYLLGTHFRDIP